MWSESANSSGTRESRWAQGDCCCPSAVSAQPSSLSGLDSCKLNYYYYYYHYYFKDPLIPALFHISWFFQKLFAFVMFHQYDLWLAQVHKERGKEKIMWGKQSITHWCVLFYGLFTANQCHSFSSLLQTSAHYFTQFNRFSPGSTL